MKLTKREKHLLSEAYRRFNQFADGKPLHEAWVGLGSKSAYKSRFFKPVHPPVKHCSNWWKLSEKGINVMKQIIKLNKWNDKEMSLKIFEGYDILTFPESV